MIPIETQYKNYNQELLTIIKVFKTWHYYLKGYKYKILVITDHNNLYQFCYHFQVDYPKEKANKAVGTLSQFFQKFTDKKTALRAENTQIFYYLQISLVKANLSGFSLLTHNLSLLFFYQVLICKTYIFF